MKRVGNLWPQLTSFEHLLLASKKAAAGKRNRPDVAAFLLNLEWNLLELRRELLEERYEPGPYRTFQVLDPKPRHISAAPFRDRVVHHALTSVLEPIFEPRFSPASFACRTGMGVHKALARAREGVRRYRHVLKVDVRKYFASIDHQILNQQLARTIKCGPTLHLAARIIESSNQQEEFVRYFPGDDLFSPLARRRGLPLGNQSSQFFANVYLTSLDHRVAHENGGGIYVRYVDDLVLFSDNPDWLREMKALIGLELATCRLDMHPGKSRLARCVDGVTFLGWRLFPDRARLVAENVSRFRRRLGNLRDDFGAGRSEWAEVRQSVRAWIAHAAHGDTWVLRERLLAGFAFERGVRPQPAGRGFQ